jgi:putative peptidoglycan lipid II flippase
MLKHGTGLLLSLGHQVTVTSVRLDLGQYTGAALQLRAGNGAAFQDLPVVATASNAGGVLRLTLHHPVTAKYLLIWITVLPPDGAGHYQASLSHVVVSGRR